jgi:hypothetical protein
MKRDASGRFLPPSTPADQVHRDDDAPDLPEPKRRRRPPASPGGGPRHGGATTRRFRVEEVLRPGEHDDYVTLALLSGTTILQLRAWLAARGHTASLGAVGAHRRRLRARHAQREGDALPPPVVARAGVTPSSVAPSSVTPDCAARLHGPDLAQAALDRCEHLLDGRLAALERKEPDAVDLAEIAQLVGLLTKTVAARKALAPAVEARRARTKSLTDEAERLARIEKENARAARERFRATLSPDEQVEFDRKRIEARLNGDPQDAFGDAAQHPAPTSREARQKIHEVVRRVRRVVGFSEEEAREGLDLPPSPQPPPPRTLS